VAFGLTSLLLSSCGTSLPSDNEVKSAVTEPLLTHATYNGVTLPRDAVSVDHINIVSIKKSDDANTPHFQVEANATLALVKNGNEISHEVARNGLQGIFALQQFTRSMGFTLKVGQTLNYKIHADLVKQDDHYVVDDGSVEPF
jgi:hypothetical protein